jgi:phosphoribosylaminoimidazole-succinocarboxamide synthase
MNEFYTDEELAALREQLRNANALAKEAAIKRGITLHPRIAEHRANITTTESK